MYENSFENKADLGGPAVESIGLLPLNCWDYGFDSRWWHWHLSLLYVVCRVGSGLCDGLVTLSEECECVSVCVW